MSAHESWTPQELRGFFEARLEVVQAIITSFERREEVLKIIDDAGDHADAMNRLAAHFAWSDLAARAIVDLRLEAFTRVGRERHLAEREDLRIRLAELG